MNTLINYLLEANLGLCLFLIVYVVFLRSETDFRLKRGFMLLAIFVSVVFPLLHFNTASKVIPSLGDFVPPTWLPEVVVEADGSPSGTETHINFDARFLFNCIYSSGVLAGLTLFLIRLAMLLKIIYQATPCKLNKVLIIESTENKSAFSFFQFIFIGQADQLSNHEKEQIIHHECVHAKQLHSFDMLLMNALSVFFWFNPVLKIYKKIFIQLHEFEADARAVENRDVNDYCSLLAKVALQSADFKLANHFSNSLTLKRIEMMRTLKQKIKIWKIVACAAVIPIIFFIVACQDQVMNEVTEIANSSTMALDIPGEVQQKYEELRQANPDKKFLVVETDENLKPKLDQMKLKLERLDQNQISHINLITPTAKPSDPVRTFAIIEYNEMMEKISERSMEDEIFTVVEEGATYVGDVEELKTFLSQNLLYPAEARRAGKEGTVFTSFVVNTDGSLTDFAIIKGVDPQMDDEALRVVKSLPNWNPGKQGGKVIRQRFVLPIKFQLQNTIPTDVTPPSNGNR